MTTAATASDSVPTLDVRLTPKALDDGVTVYECTATLRLNLSNSSVTDGAKVIKRVQDTVESCVQSLGDSLAGLTQAMGAEQQKIGDQMDHTGLEERIDHTEGYWRATYFRVPLARHTAQKKTLVGAHEPIIRQMLKANLESSLGKLRAKLEEEGWSRSDGSMS